MNELIKKRSTENIGKEIKIFLLNNFRYFGKLKNCDNNFLELYDYRSSSYRIINFSEIQSIEFIGGEDDR